MFLKRLMIENDSVTIRDIQFRKGINLVIDETSTERKKESGNNVGKTTVLRLIDYCLGSGGKNIYKDPEFNSKSNSKIEAFLTENNVCVTLVLKEDLDVRASREITIKRNFLKRSQKIIEVNGKKIKSADFPENLKPEIFETNIAKPTFKQIKAKNIRDEKNRLVNTIKVLDAYSKAEEYEALYLFWLGIELDVADRKQSLFSQRKMEENLQIRLKKENTISQIEQSLLVIDSEIGSLEELKEILIVNDSYLEDFDELNKVKSEINRLSTRMSRLRMRKYLIEESIEELEKEVSNLDVERIRRLYDEAKALLPEVQRSFDDTLKFHNGMILEKRKFIEKELPALESEMGALSVRMSELLRSEADISERLKKSGAMEDFQDLVVRLNSCYETKGTIEEQKRLWDSSIEKLSSICSEIEKLDKGIDSLDEKIQERVSVFNKFFSKLSNDLYGEKFVLSADKNEKGYELNISNLIGNPGTGKKKGETAAFDLAYIKFADHMGIKCLHFVLQDQIENIHDNQISSILIGVVENMNCQYVLPVLKDKLPTDVGTSQYEILSLSQSDKLFKV